MKLTLVIPSHNNLRHLKNAYASILKHAPKTEVILLDDGSTDGTWEWIWQLAESHQHREVKAYKSKERVGHTVLYDKGIELATNEIVGIMHADMIMGPNYVENLLKHLKPGTVVCGTRIEPPLHPEGKEKIIANFGLDFDDLNVPAFEEFCLQKQNEFKGQTTKGMFAPWVIYKKDFASMGGHDAVFAPFPYEDSDIFQRWLLAGYQLIQSRDAFVYHLTCRGHRWTEKIQQDDDYYKTASRNAARNYIRKWGSWIKNDEYQHPVLPKRYDVGFQIKNCNLDVLYFVEPWADNVYVDDSDLAQKYVQLHSKETDYDLSTKILRSTDQANNDILVEFDAKNLNNSNAKFISSISELLDDVEETGDYEWDVFRVKIKKLEPLQLTLPFVIKKNIF